MMSKIESDGELSKFISKERKEEFDIALSEKDEWLNTEGYESTAVLYEKHLNELRLFGEPLKVREEELRKRPNLVSVLQTTIENFKTFTKTTDENFSHLTTEDRNKILEECTNVENWLNNTIQKQSKLNLYDDPILTSNDLNRKNDQLTNNCNATKFKSKPKDFKKEEKKRRKKRRNKR